MRARSRGAAAGGAGAGEAALNRLLGSMDGSAGAAAGFDTSPFQRFCSLLSPPASDANTSGSGGIRPKVRPLSWVMRHVEDIYDARYAKDTADLKSDSAGSAASTSNAGPSPFPVFVVDFFTKRYGLRSLIDQTAWDLLASVAALRQSVKEVDLFARFLSEDAYDADDVLFFLYVRSVAQKELGLSFKGRWAEAGGTGAASPAAAYALSPREASLVARVVFGSADDPLCRSFLALAERHMTSSASAAGGGKKGAAAADRRIDVTTFLSLALDEYHETRPDSAAAAEAAAAVLANAAAAAGASDDSSSPSPISSGTSSAPSPALLEALGEAMHAANEGFIARLLLGPPPLTSAAGAGQQEEAEATIAAYAALPDDVRGQIASEVQAQLEVKVDGVLAAVINASQQQAQDNGAASSSSPQLDALTRQFGAVLSSAAAVEGGSGDVSAAQDAISSFCEGVLDHDDVRGTIPQLAGLLVTYAVSRLQQQQQQQQ